jgi:hypothetical protein
VKPSVLVPCVLLVLAGCASPPPVETPRPAAPVPHVPADTWHMLDTDVWIASRDAKLAAEAYAEAALSDWMARVRKQTEQDFIPWYTSFGTQQWLSVKAGWYGLSDPERSDAAAKQLAEYLREQFYERVLEPVSRELDPQTIRERSAALYVRDLDTGIKDLPRRYRLPESAFQARLERVTAIRLLAASGYRVSLYELVAAGDPNGIPGYAALLQRTRPDDGGSGLSAERFQPVTSANADELGEQLALRGGASIAGLALGGAPGMLLSLGVSGWQAMEHENRKPALEAELRTHLNPALDEMWRFLAHDPYGGVLAPVNHMSAQIENGLLSDAIMAEQRAIDHVDVF